MSSSIAIPSPRYGASARTGVASTSSDSSHSDRSATSSPSSSWAPEGVYVPVHKRRAAHSSVTSLPSIGSNESSCMSHISLTQSEANSHSFPASTDSTPRIYSRAALLSLARSPLSSHPVPSLSSDFRSTFPEIIDERASGIARALAMGRTPVWHGNSGKSRGRRPRGAKRGNGNGGKTEKRDESLSSVGSERSRGSWRSN